MSKITDVILSWPESRVFNAREAFISDSSFQNAPDVLLSFALHEFLDLLENGKAIHKIKFANRFPEIRTLLLDKLCLVGDSTLKHTSKSWPKVGENYAGCMLEQIIGVGASSRVFVATQQELGNRRVIVKVTDEPTSEFFELGKICHPAVTEVYSVATDEISGLHSCCQKYFSEWTASDLSKCHPSLSSIEELILPWDIENKNYYDTVHQVCSDVLSGLDVVHSAGLLHNDIKPHNILVSRQLRGMLIDFNSCSRILEVPQNRFIGTLPYLAPELLISLSKNSRNFSPTIQSDLFSTAATFFEILTGQSLFEPSKEMSDPNSLSGILSQHRCIVDKMQLIPRKQDREILRKALASDPSERYHSASEFLEAWSRPPYLKRVRFSSKTNSRTVKAFLALALSILFVPFLILYLADIEFGSSELQANNLSKTKVIPSENVPSSGFDVFYAKRPHFREAVDHRDFESALKIVNESHELLGLAEAAALRGSVVGKMNKDHKKVVDDLQFSVVNGCQTQELHNNLAFALIRMRRIAEAKLILDKLLAENPDFFQPYFHRAFVEFISSKQESRLPDPRFAHIAIQKCGGNPVVLSVAKVTLKMHENVVVNNVSLVNLQTAVQKFKPLQENERSRQDTLFVLPK